MFRVIGFGKNVKACKSFIKVDWDIDFGLLLNDEVLLKWLDMRARKLGLRCIARPSTNGGMHVSCCSEREMREEERLAYEIAMLDDPARIMYNLRRLLRFGRLYDRLFTKKDKLLREPI